MTGVAADASNTSSTVAITVAAAASSSTTYDNNRTIRQSHRFKSKTIPSQSVDGGNSSSSSSRDGSSIYYNSGNSNYNKNQPDDNTGMYNSSRERDRQGDGTDVAASPSAVANDDEEKQIRYVQGISDRLETGLNDYALRAILDLLKRGDHPDSIVAVVTSLACTK